MNVARAAMGLRVAFAIALGVMAHRAAATPLDLTEANIAGVIDPLMAAWIDQHRGPGAVVVVVNRDGQVFARGYGQADVAAKRPFTADETLVRPGSISKLFTGIAVMQLVDAGKLDLDRDINAYIDFAIPLPQGGVPVTLRRLLNHRVGFEEHVKGLFAKNGEPEPLGRWLAGNLPRRLFPNGDVEAYSNYGFALAGYIVERVSGEPYVSYIQRHIFDPLGMRHSTFRQPLPDELAPMMAKGYMRSDKPPLPFFETVLTPAGALSATGEDIGRFMRALINGGELDGVRILAKARLDEMMARANATPAGYLGLVFFGTRLAGHNTIGHDGITMTFFSELKIFPEQGIGIFVSRDGIGEIKSAREIPRPTVVIARRFLPETGNAANARADTPSDPALAGIYQTSRRTESTFVRVSALLAQIVIKVDADGHARRFSALWPFGEGAALRHIGTALYQSPTGGRVALVDGHGAGSYLATPAIFLQRVPPSLDLRWIAPAFLVGIAVINSTVLLAWPLGALWRCWRKTRWSEDDGDRRKFLIARIVLLVDAMVLGAVAVLFTKSSDYTIFNSALDPLLLTLYAFAWLGVLGAPLTLWIAADFWRKGVGSRWSRIHHSLMAASSVMIAWFFVTFGIAGTSLIY